MASDLLLSETMSDITLKVRHEGYSWRFPAHSLLLVNKSSTLRNMLDERAEDDNPTPLSFVGVMRPETALDVLKYIYNDEYPTDITADLIITAQRYHLTSLQENVEERFMSDMTVIHACKMLEELQQRHPVDVDCAIKTACLDMLETHALTLFGSDLVLLLGKTVLTQLLQSSNLNIPDDAYAFWGIWRWGRRQCSKSDRCLTDQSVASHIDDLITLIRNFSVQNREGIPSVASDRFNRCKGPRNKYCCPHDIMTQASSFRPCASWEDIIPPKITSEEEVLCIQLSFEKDVMLVGMTFETCPNEPNSKLKPESYLRLIREVDSVELRRQRVYWCRCGLRRTTVHGEPECWLEAEFILIEPIFLEANNLYSIYLHGNFSSFAFPWTPISKKRLRVGDTFIKLHGEGVTAVREMNLMPDMTVTWGPRGLWV